MSASGQLKRFRRNWQKRKVLQLANLVLGQVDRVKRILQMHKTKKKKKTNKQPPPHSNRASNCAVQRASVMPRFSIAGILLPVQHNATQQRPHARTHERARMQQVCTLAHTAPPSRPCANAHATTTQRARRLHANLSRANTSQSFAVGAPNERREANDDEASTSTRVTQRSESQTFERATTSQGPTSERRQKKNMQRRQRAATKNNTKRCAAPRRSSSRSRSVLKNAGAAPINSAFRRGM